MSKKKLSVGKRERRAQVGSEIRVRRVQARCQVKGNVCIKENVVSEKKDSLTNPMAIVYLYGKTACCRHSHFLHENMAASLWKQFLYTGLRVLECSTEEWSGFLRRLYWLLECYWATQQTATREHELASVFCRLAHWLRSFVFSHQCVCYVLTSRLGSAKTGSLVCLGFSFIWTAVSKHMVPYKNMEYLDPPVSVNTEI